MLKHVMVRRVERSAIFRDDTDRADFVARLAALPGRRPCGSRAGRDPQVVSLEMLYRLCYVLHYVPMMLCPALHTVLFAFDMLLPLL